MFHVKHKRNLTFGLSLLQFVFIDGADIPVGPRPYKLKNALKINSSNTALHGKYIA